MKLIRSTRLVFGEGRSDKVYEIDLCEVGPDQLVVNFRYGKRGATLKDGSKTALPVARAEAERIYEKLVRQQHDKGYVSAESREPAAREVPAPAAVASEPARVTSARGAASETHDRRAARVLERLAGRHDVPRDARRASPPRGDLERAIWRAGELRLSAAEPLLLGLLGSDRSARRGLRHYCIAWALGRLGSSACLDALTALYTSRSEPAHVQRIALLALLARADERRRAALCAGLVARLPPALQAALREGDSTRFAGVLRSHLASPHGESEALDLLYLLDVPLVRPALLEALREVPLDATGFQVVRRVFKAAAYRADAEVFGLLAYRFEKTRACFSHRNLSMRSRHGGGVLAYGEHTRRYLRRRVWRTLRRTAELGDSDYVKLAVGVLLPFRDEDAVTPRARWDAWAPYWAFNWILFGESTRYEPSPQGRTFRRVASGRARAPSGREEAFSALWDQRPEGLMHLLADSACLPVHEMATRALRGSPRFLAQLELEDILLLLDRPYEVTAQLGLDLAQQRYEPTSPDLVLLGALARSAHRPARAQALRWLDAQRAHVLKDAGLLAALVLAEHGEVRTYARELLRSARLPEVLGIAVLARVVSALLALAPDAPASDARARDATATLTEALAAQLDTLEPEIARDLLAHPLPGVQELGAGLVLRRDARGGRIDDEVLLAVLQSAHENVCAVGIRILSELPDGALAQRTRLLVRLAADKRAPLRDAARSLIRRVLAARPETAEPLGRDLLAALLRRKLPQEVPAHVVALLTNELHTVVAGLPLPEVFRLLQSASPEAQQLGAHLLPRFSARAFDLTQIIELASHPLRSVRQLAWSYYAQEETRVRASLAEAARILDAPWDDTRAFAFSFFRERLGGAAFEADVLVTILDSVRDDVQAFGRELVTRHLRDADGPLLLRKLAEHPAPAVQLFTTHYLARYAAGDPAALTDLLPYFTRVLSRVHHGRIARQRVLAFLEQEGAKSEPAARIVLELLQRVAVVTAIEYRGAVIAAMVAIQRAQPGAPSALRIVEPPLRTARGALSSTTS